MQIHTIGKGAVITLEPAEQFRLAPQTEDAQWYATRVETVTAFGGKEPYFTVAGQQIHAPLNADPFWEMPVRFPDAGVLPPHVRDVVEKIVPVADLRDSAGKEQQIVERRSDFEFAPPDVQDNVVEQIQADEHAALTDRVVRSPYGPGPTEGPLGAVDSSKSWSERLVERGRRSNIPQLQVRSPQVLDLGPSPEQAASVVSQPLYVREWGGR